MLQHLVHDCHHRHQWNSLCSFCWMLIVWALDKKIDQEWGSCIFDVGFDIHCVLFGWCKGEGVTSQVIHIIQKSNNILIDMSQVVHIIQKSNIMSCFHSLHVDILESIYLGLWHVVSFTCGVWHHISRYILNVTYQNNMNLNNIIKAWCCSLPSISLVPCTTLVPLSSPPNSVPEKFKGYLAIQYSTFLLRKYYPFLMTKTGDRWALRWLALIKKISFFFLPAWLGQGQDCSPSLLHSAPLLSSFDRVNK